MNKYNIDELKNIVSSMLSEYRYKHSLNVADLAKELAIANDVDPEKAYVAGLLHDITKELNDDWQNYCLYKNNDLDKIDIPEKIKHSYTSKYFIEDNLNIKDEEILDAVYNHTICNSDKILSKILYIADKREVGRKLDKAVIDLAKNDLESAYIQVTKEVEDFLKTKNNE